MHQKHYIGENLAILLAQSQWTQTKLGAKALLSQPTVSRLLGGQPASQEQVRRLAEAFQVPEERLTFQSGPSFRPKQESGNGTDAPRFRHPAEILLASKEARIEQLEREKKDKEEHIKRLEQDLVSLNKHLLVLLRQQG